MLFDWLVVGQVVATDPAHSVRGPKHVVKTGKTTVLTGEQARELLDSIDTSTLVGLRDRALISVMTFAFARVSISWAISPGSPVIRYRASFAPSARILPFAIMAQRRQDRRNRRGEAVLDLLDLAPQLPQFVRQPAGTQRAAHQRDAVRGVGRLVQEARAPVERDKRLRQSRNVNRGAAANARARGGFVAKPAARQITGDAHPGGGGFDLQTLAVCRMDPNADRLGALPVFAAARDLLRRLALVGQMNDSRRRAARVSPLPCSGSPVIARGAGAALLLPVQRGAALAVGAGVRKLRRGFQGARLLGRRVSAGETADAGGIGGARLP